MESFIVVFALLFTKSDQTQYVWPNHYTSQYDCYAMGQIMTGPPKPSFRSYRCAEVHVTASDLERFEIKNRGYLRLFIHLFEPKK
jgi:hypothetical protein